MDQEETREDIFGELLSAWYSIRQCYPAFPDDYKVYDCQNNLFGTAYYDGYDWKYEEFIDNTKRGSLILIIPKVTHWKRKND